MLVSELEPMRGTLEGSDNGFDLLDHDLQAPPTAPLSVSTWH